MSNISSVNGPNNPYQTTNPNSLVVQAFQSIGSALQSGDVSSAQNALTTFQQDLQGNSSAPVHQPFGRNHVANTAFQNLSGALQSGNLSGAQNAFASLQTALSRVLKGRIQPGSSGATSNAPASNTSNTSSSSATTSSATDDDSDDDGSGLNVTA